MRLGILAIGVVLAIVGGVLLSIPLFPQQSTTVTGRSPDGFNVTAAFYLTGADPFTVSWTSPATVWFFAITCSSIDLAAPNPCVGGRVLSSSNGTSGTFSWDAKIGSSVLLATPPNSSTPVSVKVTAASPVLGGLLLVVGILVGLVGLLLRRGLRPQLVAPASPSSAVPPGPPLS